MSRMHLGWRGSTLPLCPLFEVRHRPYVLAPEMGMSSPPHRLAEGSGPSSAHNTEERMELLNWAAFFLTHTGVILLRERLLRPIKLTLLDLMLQGTRIQFEREDLCVFYQLCDRPVLLIKLFKTFSNNLRTLQSLTLTVIACSPFKSPYEKTCNGPRYLS